MALQLQVQVYARSSGVCVVVDDAGAGLRKMPQPGDEVGHCGGVWWGAKCVCGCRRVVCGVDIVYLCVLLTLVRV